MGAPKLSGWQLGNARATWLGRRSPGTSRTSFWEWRVGVEARADRARAASGQLTVVYLNHTGRVGGGERSLLTLLAALPPTIRRVVACPDGDLVTRATRIG